jgi:hypothetical protein
MQTVFNQTMVAPPGVKADVSGRQNGLPLKVLKSFRCEADQHSEGV